MQKAPPVLLHPRNAHIVVEAARSANDSARVISVRQDDSTARARAACEVAQKFAVSVDREARFPHEAMTEIRKQRLLGIMLPQSLGGSGATLAQVADVCFILGQGCASTALIYAMHQVKIACLMRHAGGSVAVERILRRVANDQLLFASSTTEGQAGGNVRSSEAPIVHTGDEVILERKATVISYASEADGLVTTARRSAESRASDQVLLVLLKADYTLEKLQGWDTLGMRGTHSEGFNLRVRATSDQVLAQPYEKIHAQTMVPTAHILWGSVWAGIAAAASAKAQAFLRHAMRQSGGQLPPGAPHFSQAVSSLRTVRGVLAAALRGYEAALGEEQTLASLDFQSMITLTKVQVSELAAATVMSAMRTCGLTGYRNDSEFSIGRHLRDILSAPLMINNDRILANFSATALMAPLPTTISG